MQKPRNLETWKLRELGLLANFLVNSVATTAARTARQFLTPGANSCAKQRKKSYSLPLLSFGGGGAESPALASRGSDDPRGSRGERLRKLRRERPRF